MSAPQSEYQEENLAPAQNDYESRTGQRHHIPVQKDEADVEDPLDLNNADADAQLERDDADAIDMGNIIDEHTRDATKSYREPGDEEGLGGPEDGRSRVAGGPN